MPSASSGKIVTVEGPVEPAEIGMTQMHEHLIIDFLAVNLDEQGSHAVAASAGGSDALDWLEPISLSNYYAVRRNPFLLKDAMQLLDTRLATEALAAYGRAGGSCLVEVTPIGLGRNPVALRQIARESGVKVVMGTGYYIRDFQPPEFATMSEQEIADIIISDIEKGHEDTGIRPGIIGEIGLTWPVHPQETKSLRAAAIAQRHTGLALTIHPGRNPRAPIEAIATVEAAGGDARRTVISHLDRTLFSAAEFVALAKTGCYCELDLFGWETRHYPLSEVDMPNDSTRVDYIIALKEAGHLEQVLVSHDVDSKVRLKPFGGEGYEHIIRNVLPVMKRKGLSDRDIETIMIDNPRRVLTIA